MDIKIVPAITGGTAVLEGGSGPSSLAAKNSGDPHGIFLRLLRNRGGRKRPRDPFENRGSSCESLFAPGRGLLLCGHSSHGTDHLRKHIDSIDSQLLKLLNERADLVHQIGEVKKEQGLQIYAPEREEAVFQGLVKKNAEAKGGGPKKSVRAIYREIMSAALALEDDLKHRLPRSSWDVDASGGYQ